MIADAARATAALHAIPPDLPRDAWVKSGMAFHAAGGDFDTFNEWSAPGATYNAADCRATWRSFKAAPGGVGAGALFGMARDHGWQDGNATRQAPAKAAEPPHKATKGNSASELFGRFEAATNEHGYIAAKQAAGVPLVDLRVVPAGDRLTIAGQSMAGFLVVPAHAPDGKLQSLQFIPPNGGKKLNLPGASMAGASFIVGWTVPGCRVNICEGIGAAWACWQATGAAAVACFGWGNVGKVAHTMREQDATAKLVLVHQHASFGT